MQRQNSTILLIERNCPFCNPDLLAQVTHVYYVVLEADGQRYIKFDETQLIPVPPNIKGVPTLIVPHNRISILPTPDELATAVSGGQVHFGLNAIRKYLQGGPNA